MQKPQAKLSKEIRNVKNLKGLMELGDQVYVYFPFSSALKYQKAKKEVANVNSGTQKPQTVTRYNYFVNFSHFLSLKNSNIFLVRKVFHSV